MKNRVIFGELVPYGEVWRTGANKVPNITFSTDVNIILCYSMLERNFVRDTLGNVAKYCHKITKIVQTEQRFKRSLDQSRRYSGHPQMKTLSEIAIISVRGLFRPRFRTIYHRNEISWHLRSRKKNHCVMTKF